MKVVIVVPSESIVEAVGSKSGKAYAKQEVGILLPGDQFPIADEMMVERDANGRYYPKKAGKYETTAKLVRDGFDLKFDVNYRQMLPASEQATKPTVVAKAA